MVVAGSALDPGAARALPDPGLGRARRCSAGSPARWLPPIRWCAAIFHSYGARPQRHRAAVAASILGVVLVLMVGRLLAADKATVRAATSEKPCYTARDEPDRPAPDGQADRLFRLPARLPVDLRARSRTDRRAHHRPRARRQGQRLHGRRDLRQGRALRRARASHGPAAASAAARRRQRLRRIPPHLLGRRARSGRREISSRPSSATAPKACGPITMPAPWAW